MSRESELAAEAHDVGAALRPPGRPSRWWGDSSRITPGRPVP